jgi:glutathione S-transferase
MEIDEVRPNLFRNHFFLSRPSSSPIMSAKPVIVYWNICGRAHLAMAMLHAGNVEYDLDSATANTWPAPKSDCPFGQLPILKHGDLVLAQSGAITRYCARIAGLFPADAVSAAKCDMVLEECADLYSLMIKAKYPANPSKEEKMAAWDKIKLEHLPAHLSYLERLLEKSSDSFFGGSSPNAADVALAATMGVYFLAGFPETTLEAYPKLKHVVTEANKLGSLSLFQPGGPYFTCDPDHAMF